MSIRIESLTTKYGFKLPLVTRYHFFKDAQAHQQMQHNQIPQQNPGNLAAQNQELLKKQQFEEQKRKFKEFSSRGSKSKQTGGKNMLDDLISKTDLGLSASSTSRSLKNDGLNRPTNVFTGKMTYLLRRHLQTFGNIALH